VLSYRAHGHHLDHRLAAKEYVHGGAGGVQDTPPGSGALALAARVEDVGAETWESARVDERTLVESWSVRGAPLAFARSDHQLFTNGVCPNDEDSWWALLGGQAKLRGADLAPSGAVQRVATEVAALLKAGPMSKADISTALRERELLPAALMPWCQGCGEHHVGEQLLRVSGLMGQFCFGPVIDGHLTLVRVEDWVGSGIRMGPAKRYAQDLLRRFLVLYGPADAALFASWTGIGLGDAQRRFEAFDGELVPVIVAGTRRWLPQDEVERFRSTPPIKGVRLLPPSDPFLQQRDRELLVPDAPQRKIVWKALGAPGVVLVDGHVGAVWRPHKRGSKLTVRVEPFGPLNGRARALLDDEAATVAAVRGCDRVEVSIGS
jgi:hypothetical protein